MQNKKIIIYAAVALVLLAGLAYFLIFGAGKSGGGEASPAAGVSSTTVPAIPSGTVAPSLNPTSGPSGALKPPPANVKETPNFFSVAIADGKVTPANVNISAGAVTKITFSADNAEGYAFTQPENGLSWFVPAGGLLTVQFEINKPGKYIYYCKSCGGPEKGPVGYITAK